VLLWCLQAITDFTRVLSAEPTHVNAAYARAACYNRKVIDASLTSLWRQICHGVGGCQGDFSQAIEDYNLALTNDSGSKVITSPGAAVTASPALRRKVTCRVESSLSLNRGSQVLLFGY
jgi:hypothetical protein